MNDDALHPSLELASAYLDGDLSVDQRALAEATPEVMAAVESLRAVHAELADVPPVSDSVRNSAILAALAEFDALAGVAGGVAGDVARDVDGAEAGVAGDGASGSVAGSPAAAPATGGVVLSFFRRRSTVLLGAAAAALLVGIVGATALRDNDDAGSAAVERTADQSYSATDETIAMTESAPVQAGDGAITGINGPAVAAVQVNDAASLLAFANQMMPMPTAPSAGSSTTAPAVTALASEATTAAPSDTLAAFDTAGAQNDSVAGAPGGVAPTAFPCPLTPSQVVFADIIWIDAHAWAVRDMATGVVQAIADDCSVLATVGP